MNLNHGGLENLIMNVLWDNSEIFEGIMSVTQVWERLNGLNTKQKWAYTTVKTVLDRLADKGMLDKIKCGKKYNYKAIMPRREMAEKALKQVALDYFSNDILEMSELVREIAYEEEKNLVHVYR